MTTTTRVRGFAPWRLHRQSRVLVEQVQAIIEEYNDQLPLTLRQIFYILVSNDAWPKTENAYKALGEKMNRGRRAGMIPWDAIRDDGHTYRSTGGYISLSHFWHTVRRDAEDFTLDRQQDQPRRLMLWCEAAGMVPQLMRVAEPYGIAVASGSGFDSVTAKYEAAQLITGNGPTTILHLGDYDPSGVHVHSALSEDLGAFVDAMGGDVEVIRIAVTPEQVDRYDLPTAPPKKEDKRSFDGDATTQCEALPPTILADLVREAIESRIDAVAYKATLAEEERLRAAAVATMERLLSSE
ncbi:MAG TPA: hypothetical protein ENI96_09975 [Sedimenticola thiotaurini]|uniref:DUF2399 domain-containing protein n=1 Tax=Sedimenticola thiotaurini TaxID=1543721 RepID=A0A831W7P1_9GAMM|nr:hypothetical protein [Sedimenticola thiotaurini]